MSRNCIYDIINKQLLVDTVLAGVDLRLEDGEEFADAMWTRSIEQGISYVESSLDVLLKERIIKGERQEHTPDYDNNWVRFHITRVPVQSITRLTGNYGNLTPIEYPVSWAQLDSAFAGYVSIIPTATSAGVNDFIQDTGGLRIELFYGSQAGVPGWYGINYKAGFPCFKGDLTIADGEEEVTYTYPDSPIHPDFRPEIFSISSALVEVTEISNESVTFATVSGEPALGDIDFSFLIHTFPQLVIDLILRRAGQYALAVAGDLILGAGIAGFSRSMDSLVEAVQSTSSPTNSGYGARILQFEREAQQIEALLKPMFRGHSFFAV